MGRKKKSCVPGNKAARFPTPCRSQNNRKRPNDMKLNRPRRKENEDAPQKNTYQKKEERRKNQEEKRRRAGCGIGQKKKG